jgi:uncharacterized protein with HEPN domain
MPERPDIRLFCDDIVEAIDRIVRYTAGMTYEEFAADTKTQDAVIRNLEILGEAVRSLPEAFKDQYPDVPWREIRRMRDRLIHHYFGVSLKIVWETVQTDIPALRKQLRTILTK